MKIFKKILVFVFIIFFFIPNNIVKADDNIMLTEAAYICSKCGGTFVNVYKSYTSDWTIYKSVHCAHHLNGFDHTYYIYYDYVGSCTNCGNQLYDLGHRDSKVVCAGF